jgi:hypothetical protein
VAGCCECGDEPSGSCATELVMRKEAFLDYFKEISHHLHEGTEKTHKKPWDRTRDFQSAKQEC